VLTLVVVAVISLATVDWMLMLVALLLFPTLAIVNRLYTSRVEKPIGEWNQYEITCKGNTIKLTVNGVFQNEGTQAESSKATSNTRARCTQRGNEERSKAAPTEFPFVTVP